jgi:prepilin-type N-terminal cleavage/methylation domain-containing protein
MKQNRAFTLIEVIISIIILSGAIVYVLNLHSQTRYDIEYIVQRNKLTLQDSLFVAPKILRFHKETKSAYDIINDKFTIDKLKTREILQNIKREIFIPESISVSSDEDTLSIPSIQIQEIKLKDKYSSYYFHFNIISQSK